MSNMYDDLFGVADPGQFEDGFDAQGEESGYPQPMWFTGYRNPIINPITSKASGKAIGFAFEVKKCPKDLKEIFTSLVDQKKARVVLVEHQGKDKTRKHYYQFTEQEQSFYPLIHGMPSRPAIEQNPALQISIAVGKRVETIFDKKPPLYKMETFFTFLAVSRTLYEAGYAEEDGTPKLITLRAKGVSTDELWKVLLANANFLRAARDEGVDPRRAQLWAYALTIRPSQEPVEHGKQGETTPVYAFENATFEEERPAYQQVLDEQLYCGDEMYQLLFPLLYNTKVKPVVPGGLVAQWCRKTCAKALGDLLAIDPKRQLQVGTFPAPAWLLTSDMRKNASLPVEETGPQRGQSLQEDPTQQLKGEFGPAIKRFEAYFKNDGKGDKEGLALMLDAWLAIEDDFLAEGERRDTVNDLLARARERRTTLRRKIPVDPYDL